MPDLFPLYKLHLVDATIADIKKRAAALDPGKEIMGKIKTLEEEHRLAHEQAHEMSSELTDLELQQKSMDEKIARFDKELYSGKIVNPREVESIQKEIQNLKKLRGNLDGRVLELWELLPPAKKRASETEAALKTEQSLLNEHQKQARIKKADLEAEFKRAVDQRPALAAKVDPGLLRQYTALRDRAGGIGIAEVSPKGSCARCGMSLPEKTLQLVKEDKLVVCESCHRILFRVAPV